MFALVPRGPGWVFDGPFLRTANAGMATEDEEVVAQPPKGGQNHRLIRAPEFSLPLEHPLLVYYIIQQGGQASHSPATVIFHAACQHPIRPKTLLGVHCCH